MQLIAPVVAVAALVAGAQAQGTPPTVTTPTSLVECQPAQFTVSGGTAPYFIAIIPGGQAGSAPLETLPDQAQAGPVTWTVDQPAGQTITVQVRDSTGALNYSQQVTVQPGSSTSCLGSNASAGGAGGASSAAGGASSAAASAGSVGASATSAAASVASSARSQASSAAGSATSAARSSAAGSTPAGASPSSAASPSASGSSGANKVAATGFVGLAGAVFAALFALIAREV